MGRWNDKHFSIIAERQKDYSDIKVFIETGTGTGAQTEIAAKHFETVETIELDQGMWQVAQKKIGGLQNVRSHRGSTTTFLPFLLRDVYSDVPVFAYLDAHYCLMKPAIQKSPFPLWKELELFKERKHNDIVVVDDMHTFGKVREDLRYEPGCVEWEEVTTENLLKFYDGLVVDSMPIGGSFVMWLKGE